MWGGEAGVGGAKGDEGLHTYDSIDLAMNTITDCVGVIVYAIRAGVALPLAFGP